MKTKLKLQFSKRKDLDTFTKEEIFKLIDKTTEKENQLITKGGKK